MTATARIGRPAPLVENVEWMADTGEVLAGIARRLGISEDSVKRQLQRHGRPDLIRRIDPTLNQHSHNQWTARRAS